MKKISLIGGAILVLIGLTSLNLKSPVTTMEQHISFYQTNLVCGAAPDIGCGTRAKPILVAFMQHESVSEAWLNHAGTIIGVVWKQGQDGKRVEIANRIFASYEQPFISLNGKDHESQLSDFKKGKWYKGSEVDQLSIIEAGRIADKLMQPLDTQLDATPQEKEVLRAAFEAYIKAEFLKIEDATVINEPGYWKRWERELTAIGRELIGEDMPDIQLVSGSNADQPDKSKCTKDGKSSCCKKGI